jgi:hypothetical protein
VAPDVDHEGRGERARAGRDDLERVGAGAERDLALDRGDGDRRCAPTRRRARR